MMAGHAPLLPARRPRRPARRRPACGPDAPPPPAPAAAPAARDVRTARVEELEWPRALRATGELAAFEEATLSAKVPGRLARIAVDVGQRVAQGELVAQVDARDYELRVAQSAAALAAARAALGLSGDGEEDAVGPLSTPAVRSAQAELDDAKLERDRQSVLASRGISAQSDLDRAEARLRKAESGLQDALQAIEARRALV
jgi:multidrug efflux pump subunit AcrA (membrane-fusion protein)